MLTGKRKDLVIVNGHNVYCHEVEDAATAVAGCARARSRRAVYRTKPAVRNGWLCSS